MAGNFRNTLKSAGELFGLTGGPLGAVLDAINKRRQRDARKSIWDNLEQKSAVPQYRRILDFAAINFDDSYVVGINIIDSKHKIIMLTYNSLVNDAMRLRRSKSKARQLTERLMPLLMTISEHFSEEEEVMLKQNFPNLYNHKCQHDQFMCDALLMIEEIEAGRQDYEQLIFFIGAWISGHMLISDRYFSDFYHSRRRVRECDVVRSRAEITAPDAAGSADAPIGASGRRVPGVHKDGGNDAGRGEAKEDGAVISASLLSY